MSAKKFKFISPAVKISESDQSQLPSAPGGIVPLVIGRTERGPAFQPVKVTGFSEFVEVFGNPIPGGQGGDVWRDGNYTAPTYAGFAAQAWLKNAPAINVVRLLGSQHPNATTAGEAGWKASDNYSPSTASATNGGAFGLFVGNIPDAGSDYGNAYLAATWYISEGSVRLVGNLLGSSTEVEGAAVMVEAANSEFKAVVEDSSGVAVLTSSFNFDRNSARYIRKVFNTNPTLCNATITQTDNVQTYFLGETFERVVTDNVTMANAWAVILPLYSTAFDGQDYKMAYQAPKTGWVFSQDLTSNTGSYDPDNMPKLFRLVGLENGEWNNKNLKVSVSDIKVSSNPDDPYGTFSVTIRKAEDSDNAPVFVEQFTNVNLNPNSSNYIAQRIGDTYSVWDETEKRYRTYGNYLNNSKYVRVEMDADVNVGATDPHLLPFGFFGPPRFSTVSWNSGSALSGVTPVRGKGSVPVHTQGFGSGVINTGVSALSCSFVFPALATRGASSEGNVSVPKLAYWGVTAGQTASSVKFDPGYGEYVRCKPVGIDSYDADNTVGTEASVTFSLDDLAWVSGSQLHARWDLDNVGRAVVNPASGSITAGVYYDAQGDVQYQSASYELVLDAQFNRFTMPLFGGFDGLDIKEKEPFRNTFLESKTETTCYAFHSIKRAIDTVADPEVVEYNVLSVPGITNETLTSHEISTCENRGDALAIIDLDGGYVPSTENNSADSANRGSVTDICSNLKTRGLNTSYGCAYHPWVQVKETIKGNLLWVPPSVVALGTFASSEKKSELWFAPAGFNRGGLTEGSAGLAVVNVREKLSSAERDKLYENNVNPIASFPAEGIVIFGQKTLQKTPSALDRINVRRLLILVKKEISRMANSILFDQNVSRTWIRFTDQALPFLRSVRARFGISEFKLVLDDTTTTPDLVDQNIVYATLAIKPTKSVEFIGIDVSITDQGAAFTD